MKKEEILSAFQFRHACKEFDVNKKISKEDFDFILETARLSPSSFGFEPWHFVVLQDKKLRDELIETSWGAPLKLDTGSHYVLGLTMRISHMKWDSEYIQNFMKNVQLLPEEVMEGRTKFFREFQESDFDLNDDRKLFDWAGKQCYIALANMMTSAALIGIDSCPIEGFRQKDTELVLKEKLGIDMEKYGLSYMVAFGYRKLEPRPKIRRSLEEIVSWK